MLNSRLKQLRTSRGLPIIAVSVRAGVGPGTIVAVERHGHTPRPETKEKIAAALGVEVREIWPDAIQSNQPPTAA